MLKSHRKTKSQFAAYFPGVRNSLLVFGVVLLGCSGFIDVFVLRQVHAQQKASFEVESIKPDPWTGQGRVGVFVQGNSLRAEHCSLYDLVEFAWNLRDIQLSGGPSWAARGMLHNSELFQVIAKTSEDLSPSTDQFRLMLQTLLADRFRLKVHHVAKDIPIFNLVTVKSGAKLNKSASDAQFSLNVDGRVSGGRVIRIKATHASIAHLMAQVEGHAGRPVFDKTGLTGFYDFQAEWVSENSRAATSNEFSSEPNAPSLFTALQKQLGLKLEPGTGSFDTVVIDYAERPSQN
jgi:uncharacterized protein (TIGR03435 family)